MGFWEEGVWAELQLLSGAGEVEEEHPEDPSSRKRNIWDYIILDYIYTSMREGHLKNPGFSLLYKPPK